MSAASWKDVVRHLVGFAVALIMLHMIALGVGTNLKDALGAFVTSLTNQDWEAWGSIDTWIGALAFITLVAIIVRAAADLFGLFGGGRP